MEREKERKILDLQNILKTLFLSNMLKSLKPEFWIEKKSTTGVITFGQTCSI